MSVMEVRRPPIVSSFAPPRATTFADRPPRMRTYLKGLVVYGNGAFTLDCAIQDISEGGAKIALVKNQALPFEVYLIAVKQGVAYRSKVAWQKSPSRGLQFYEAHSMKWPLPDEIQYLHRYWIDRCARPGVPTV